MIPNLEPFIWIDVEARKCWTYCQREDIGLNDISKAECSMRLSIKMLHSTQFLHKSHSMLKLAAMSIDVLAERGSNYCRHIVILDIVGPMGEIREQVLLLKAQQVLANRFIFLAEQPVDVSTAMVSSYQFLPTDFDMADAFVRPRPYSLYHSRLRCELSPVRSASQVLHRFHSRRCRAPP